MSDEAKLNMILARDRVGQFRLWACRGKGLGCKRNRFRSRKTPCVDCYGPLPETLTLGEIVETLERDEIAQKGTSA